VGDSLKALDPKRPIREADITSRIASASSASPRINDFGGLH
jgi:hypothetical protein